MAHFVGTPEMESRNCPGGTPGTLNCQNSWLRSWIATRSNQSCSPRRDLFNAMLHSWIGHREEVDSRLFVVESQIASLTPGPSFAHNLGCRCPNDQCEAIFDIYVSRPFQWHQEHPNARCFAPCCRALNIRESRRTPNPNSFQMLGFTPTLGRVRVATIMTSLSSIHCNRHALCKLPSPFIIKYLKKWGENNSKMKALNKLEMVAVFWFSTWISNGCHQCFFPQILPFFNNFFGIFGI
jgi:hypothetical protein